MNPTDKRLVCPECGWDGSTEGLHGAWFRHIEEVTNVRRVEGFNDRGVLVVSGEDHIEIEDNGVNHRLQCGNCLHEFAIPTEVQIEFE